VVGSYRSSGARISITYARLNKSLREDREVILVARSSFPGAIDTTTLCAWARVATAIRKKHIMSKANGDKARFNRERRKKIARRVRARAAREVAQQPAKS